MKKKNKKNVPLYKKAVYKFDDTPNNYVMLTKRVDAMLDNNYRLIKTRNIRKYMQSNFESKIIIYKYFINDKKICIEKELLHYLCPGFSNIYTFNNINDILSKLSEKFEIEFIVPILNTEKNPKLVCCQKLITRNDDLFKHLKECGHLKYTLWYEEIPKDLKKQQNKKNINVTINNTNTQNIYNNYIPFRQTGNFIRSKLSVEQKREILNSIDKVGELVKLHFQYDEVKNNIVLKNISPYKSCEVFNGKCFIFVNNKENFRYYVMDQLDTLDYFAVVDVQDPVLTRRLEKYDDNIRKNDKNMMAMINKTMLQVKDHINKSKNV